jgi:hypothetical protein
MIHFQAFNVSLFVPAERQTERERQTDRQTDRHTDRQAE